MQFTTVPSLPLPLNVFVVSVSQCFRIVGDQILNSLLCTVYLDAFCGGLFSVALLGLYLQASRSVQREKIAGNKHHGWKMWQIAGLLHAFAWFVCAALALP